MAKASNSSQASPSVVLARPRQRKTRTGHQGRCRAGSHREVRVGNSSGPNRGCSRNLSANRRGCLVRGSDAVRASQARAARSFSGCGLVARPSHDREEHLSSRRVKGIRRVAFRRPKADGTTAGRTSRDKLAQLERATALIAVGRRFDSGTYQSKDALLRDDENGLTPDRQLNPESPRLQTKEILHGAARRVSQPSKIASLTVGEVQSSRPHDQRQVLNGSLARERSRERGHAENPSRHRRDNSVKARVPRV